MCLWQTQIILDFLVKKETKHLQIFKIAGNLIRVLNMLNNSNAQQMRFSASAVKMISLTSEVNGDKLPLKLLLGLEMGSWREYRPRKWKLKFWHNGSLIEVYTNKDGDTLESNAMCARTMAYIEELIKDRKFRKETWKKAGPHLFERACETWISSKKKLAYGTISARKRITRNYLIPNFEKMDIKDITRSHIEEFKSVLEGKGLSGKSVYNIMAELRAMLRFHLDNVPRFPVCEYQDKPIRWLTVEQQNMVIECILEEDRHIFTFQRFTGCRPNEARGLQRKNVLWDKGIIIISSVLNEHGDLIDKTKTKQVRVLPIISEIEKCLKPRAVSSYVFTRGGLPYGKRTHENIWKKAMTEANEKYGVPIVSLYPGTKHSLGMNRLKEGFGKDELQALFGHRDRKSVDHYAKYLAESLIGIMRGKVVEIKKAEGEWYSPTHDLLAFIGV